MNDKTANSSHPAESQPGASNADPRRKETEKNKANTDEFTTAEGEFSSQDENNVIAAKSKWDSPFYLHYIITDSSKEVDIMSLVHPIPMEDGAFKPIRMQMEEGRKKIKYGEPLVEIYDIRVSDMGGKKCGKIYGKIVLGCRYRHISLLNIDQENALAVESQDSLPLNGPDVAPLGSENVVVAIDLKEDGDEFCKELILWDGDTDPIFDIWFNETVIGKKGTVNVIYTVFSDACLAEVHLKLTKLAPGTSMVTIKGSVTIYFDDMQYLRTVVLCKSQDDRFTINLLDDIPLTRSLFCCRIGSSVIIKIDLRDSDNNEPLAQGSLLFPSTYYGDTVGTLSGQCSEMQVNVVWMDYAEHPKTRALRSNPMAFEEVPLFSPNYISR